MTFEEIFGLIVGILALIGLFSMLIFMCLSAEKTEQRKRVLYHELTKYLAYRNKQMEDNEVTYE